MRRRKKAPAKVNLAATGLTLGQRIRNSLPKSRRTRGALLLIFFLSILFLLLLVNQARIARMGFENAQLESEIRAQTMLNAQQREQLLKSSDLARIREAAEKLGMSMPLAGQIVRIHIARQDYITFNEGESGTDTADRQEEDLARSMKNVADYLREREGEAPVHHITENKSGKIVDHETEQSEAQPKQPAVGDGLEAEMAPAQPGGVNGSH